MNNYNDNTKKITAYENTEKLRQLLCGTDMYSNLTGQKRVELYNRWRRMHGIDPNVIVQYNSKDASLLVEVIEEPI